MSIALHQFLSRVKELTHLSGENTAELLQDTIEELGEYAAARTIEEGRKDKSLIEDSRSEAVDVTIAALSLFFKSGGEIEQLVAAGNRKLSKWASHIHPQPPPTTPYYLVCDTSQQDELGRGSICWAVSRHEDDVTDAVAWMGDDEPEANGRLFAASPALLAAAKDFLDTDFEKDLWFSRRADYIRLRTQLKMAVRSATKRS